MHDKALTDAGVGSTRWLLPGLAVALVFLPFVAKRVAVLGLPEVWYWLAWDYGARFVVLIGVALAYRSRLIEPLYRRAPAHLAIQYFLLVLVAVLFLQWIVYWLYAPYLRYLEWFQPPYIRNTALAIFDLTAGILLVAVSEELAFRRLLFALLQRLGLGVHAIVLVSATVFGLVHLTSGLADTLNAFLAGMLLGYLFHATGRIGLCIAVHYVDDLTVYWWRATISGAL